MTLDFFSRRDDAADGSATVDEEDDEGCAAAVAAGDDGRACFKHRESGQIECVICLEDFVDGEELRVLPCNHAFHVACIDEWLLERPLCPLCKAPALPVIPDETTNLLSNS